MRLVCPSSSQPLREPEAMDAIRSWSPDLIAVAAFGQILRSAILDLRASAVSTCTLSAAALARRCADPGCNSGWRFRNRRDDHANGRRNRHRTDPEPAPITIAEGETAGELSNRPAILGAELLINTLPGFLSPRDPA